MIIIFNIFPLHALFYKKHIVKATIQSIIWCDIHINLYCSYIPSFNCRWILSGWVYCFVYVQAPNMNVCYVLMFSLLWIIFMQVWHDVFESFYHMSSPCNCITAVGMISWVLSCPILHMLPITLFFNFLPKDPPFIVQGTNLLPISPSSSCYDTSPSLQHTIIFVSHILEISLDVFNVCNFAWTWLFSDIRIDVFVGNVSGTCWKFCIVFYVYCCILCIL